MTQEISQQPFYSVEVVGSSGKTSYSNLNHAINIFVMTYIIVMVGFLSILKTKRVLKILNEVLVVY